MPILWLCLDEREVTPDLLDRVRSVIQGDMEIAVQRDVPARSEEVEIAAGWVTPEAVLRLPNLRWLQHWAAGVDRFTSRPDIMARDFILTTGSGVHAIPISEHILAYLLMFARDMPRAIRAQLAHRWQKAGSAQRVDVFELAGKTMLLIGVGAIGARTAQVASALGMRVMGVRYDPSRPAAGVQRMVGPAQLLEVLPEADFVVLTVPLTQETRGMIGERELRAMKPTAILVNIGRGGTIQEEQLVRALREGWIRGAGLDVFETEPLPADSPLWDMENVIITAHYAGHGPHYHERASAIFLDNLARYLRGEALRNVVDRTRGY